MEKDNRLSRGFLRILAAGVSIPLLVLGVRIGWEVLMLWATCLIGECGGSGIELMLAIGFAGVAALVFVCGLACLRIALLGFPKGEMQ